MKKSLLILLCSVAFTSYFSQSNDESTNWVKKLTTPGSNFYDIQKSFNEYWKDKTVTPGSGYKVFKRWEAFVEPRVYPTGDLSLISTTWANYESYLSTTAAMNGGAKGNGNNMIASTTWTAMGPFGAMSGSVAGVPRKAGRYNAITFHPSAANTFWCAAPAGGLWKTTNNGSSWSTTTDYLSVIGCSDLAIDPANTNNMYLATGDGDAGDTYCIGVLKSIDGGNTWSATGLVFTVNQQRTMRRLIINPANSQILIAATNVGIYRTTDGGANWTQINNFDTYDLEFKPGDPNTVYASTDLAFYQSTNGGASFTQISNGIPTTGSTRLGIAVTTNDPNYVYVLRSNTSNGFGGLYRSTNSGTAFTLMSSTPDVLANSCAGTSGIGQGWYDLAIAASPLDKNEVVVGGVNHWRSTNGGANWTNIGCWNSTTATYVHADVHDLEYTSAGVLYTANDGGIYQYTGTSWTDITAPANIAQMYKIGCSALSPNLWITGHQDNGTNIFVSGTYSASLAGDGMDCFIDRTNDNNMFGSQFNGQFNKSTNGGSTWAPCTTGMTGGAIWVAPWKQDPVTANTLYAGRVQMFKSTNLGTSWSQSGSLPGINTNAGVIEFAIAPSNNQVIYVLHGTPGIYKSTDGGATWTNVTGTVPVGTAYPTNVCISSTNPNMVWVTLSGYSSGNKVFQSTNGGTTWTNYSTGLPNLPANCIMYEPGSADRVYAGMDVGVYFRDNTMTSWAPYNVGLPNTPINDLEISPANATKLRAATYGRGVYQVDVVNNTLPPVSNFTVATSAICSGQTVQLNDLSIFSPTSWSWSVTPITATITTQTSQNPTIVFGAAGVYTVSMIATNGNGPGNTAAQTITVSQTPTVTLSASATTVCAGTPVTFTASGAASYNWACGSSSVCTYTPSSTTTYTFIGSNAGCTSSATITVNTNPIPNINASATNTDLCSPSITSSTLSATGATTYTWNPGGLTGSSVVVTPTITTTYTITGTAAGCSSSNTITIGYFTTPTVGVSVSTPTSCAGDAVTFTASGATTYTWSNNGFTSAVVVYSPVVSTTYTVWGYNGSCMSGPMTASVSVFALPFINLTASSNTICAGNPLTLNASGGATTWTWTPGGTTGSSASYTPATTATYTVTGTNAAGCINSASKTVTVSPCSGVMQIGNETANYMVYPNPTSDKLNINIATVKSINVNIEVMDVNGKLVLRQSAGFNKSNNNYVINMGTLASGVYYIKLISGDASSQLIKIVKE